MSSGSGYQSLFDVWSDTSSAMFESLIEANRAAAVAFGLPGATSVGMTERDGDHPERGLRTEERLGAGSDLPEWETDLEATGTELQVGDRVRFSKTLAEADQAVDFPVTEPAVTAGFELESAAVGTQGDRATVTGVYANETAEFVAIQSEQNPLARIDTDGESLSVGDETVTVVERGDMTVLFWEADGRTYGVAGSLGQDQLAEIAQPMAVAD